MTATHALHDRWYVSFLPLLTSDMVNSDFQGNWQLAAQQRTQKLDWITSVEELWSTVNSLPKIHQLGVGNTLIFARNNKEPSFESFPDGSRVSVNLMKPPATTVGLELILATVLGETITATTSDRRPVCDVVRVAARPSRDNTEQIRVEVWLSDASCSSGVAGFFTDVFKAKGLAPRTFSITESAFDGGVKDKKAPSTPADQSTLPAAPLKE